LNTIFIFKDNNDIVELSSHCIISFFTKVHNQQLLHKIKLGFISRIYSTPLH